MKKILKSSSIVLLASAIIFGASDLSNAFNTNTLEERNSNYAFSKGEYARALLWYQKYMNKYKTYINSNDYYALGNLYYKNNQLEEAMNNYFTALNMYNGSFNNASDDPEVIKARLNKRNEIIDAINILALQMKKTDYITRALNIAVTQTPNEPRNYMHLANIYTYLGRPEDALNASKRYLELAPDSIDAFSYIAVSYYILGDDDKAMQTVTKILSMDPENKQAKASKAFLLFDQGKYDDTANILKNVINDLEDPNLKYRVTIRLALSYLFMDQADKALEAINTMYYTRINRNSGMTLSAGKEYPVVTNVLPGSTAAQAGVVSGDEIISVNSVPTKGKTLHDVIKMLTGQEGIPLPVEIKVNSTPAKLKTDTPEVVSMKATRKRYFKKIQPLTIKSTSYFDNNGTDIAGLASLIQKENGDKAEEIFNANAAYNVYNSVLKRGELPIEVKINKICYTNFLAQYPEVLVYIQNDKYQEALDLLNQIEKTPDLLNDIKTLIKVKQALVYYKLKRPDEALAILRDFAVDGINKNNLYLSKEYKNTLADLAPLKQELVSQEEEQARKKDYKAAIDTLNKLLALSESKEELDAIKLRILSLGKNIQVPETVADEIHKYSLRAEILLKEKDLQGALEEYKKAIKVAPFMTNLYYNTALVLGELQKYNDAINYMNTYINAEPAAPDLQQAKDEIIKWELKLEKESKTSTSSL